MVGVFVLRQVVERAKGRRRSSWARVGRCGDGLRLSGAVGVGVVGALALRSGPRHELVERQGAREVPRVVEAGKAPQEAPEVSEVALGKVDRPRAVSPARRETQPVERIVPRRIEGVGDRRRDLSPLSVEGALAGADFVKVEAVVNFPEIAPETPSRRSASPTARSGRRGRSRRPTRPPPRHARGSAPRRRQPPGPFRCRSAARCDASRAPRPRRTAPDRPSQPTAADRPRQEPPAPAAAG